VCEISKSFIQSLAVNISISNIDRLTYEYKYKYPKKVLVY